MTEDVNDLISLRLDEMDFILKAVMKECVKTFL